MSSIEYCRLCSKRSPANINIFGEQGKRHLIPLKICNIANIFITETDPLPKFVCILCIGKLNFVQNFRTECQSAQTFFRKRLCEIKPESEIEDDMNVESKFRNVFCEIYYEKAVKNESKNVGTCVNDASDEVVNCNKKVTLISKYANELSQEIGVKMEVEEVDSDNDLENSENTTVKSDKNDQKGDSKINKSSDVKDVLDHKSNISQKENSKDLEFSDSEIENVDCDYPNDDIQYPDTDVSAAEVGDDENELVVSDSNSTEESCKINKYSDGENVLNNNDCTNENDSRTAKMNELPPLVTFPKVQENLHDIEPFYFSQSENERLNQTGELFEQSHPRYFECINYIINRKCSVMPYFIKTMQNSLTRYVFKCFVCKKCLNCNHSDIIKHLTIHLHLKCTFCNYAVRTNTRLKHHINNSHYMQLLQEKIECNYCNEKFSEFDLFWSHMKTHIDEYYCGFCEFKSKDPDLLHEHVICNHKNAKATCTNCAMLYNNDFMDHLKHIKKLGFVCSSCEMAFHNEQHLYMHYKIFGKNHWSYEKIENSSSQSSDSSQKILDLDFSKLSDAKMIKLFTDIVQKKVTRKQFGGRGKSGPPICPWPGCCNSFPKLEERFIQHSQNHLLFACYECNKCYSGCNRYMNHVKRVCKITHFKCCICKNRTFEGLNEYMSHVRDHLGKRVCQYCDTVLRDCRNEKRKHMRKLHHELVTKRVICEHCGKSITKGSLKAHLAVVHNLQGPSNLCSFCGELKMNSIQHRCSSKPNDEKEEFICAYCSKVFHSKSCLIPHILVHLNEKSFSCSLCDKKFNRETSLGKHVKDMHAPKKWACNFKDCSKAFSFQSALKKHIATSH